MMNKETLKMLLYPGFYSFFGKRAHEFEGFLDSLAAEICSRISAGLEWHEWCVGKMEWRAEFAGINRQEAYDQSLNKK